jgi:hypothetical protein
VGTERTGSFTAEEGAPMVTSNEKIAITEVRNSIAASEH